MSCTEPNASIFIIIHDGVVAMMALAEPGAEATSRDTGGARPTATILDWFVCRALRQVRALLRTSASQQRLRLSSCAHAGAACSCAVATTVSTLSSNGVAVNVASD